MHVCNQSFIVPSNMRPQLIADCWATSESIVATSDDAEGWQFAARPTAAPADTTGKYRRLLIALSLARMEA